MEDFEFFFNQLDDIITVHDPKNGGVLFLNDACIAAFGLQKELLNSTGLQAITEHLKSITPAQFVAWLEEDQNNSHQVECKTNASVYDITLNVLEVNHQKVQVAVWKKATASGQGPDILNNQKVINQFARLLPNASSEKQVITKFFSMLEKQLGLNESALYWRDSDGNFILKRHNGATFDFIKKIDCKENALPLQRMVSSMEDKNIYTCNSDLNFSDHNSENHATLAVPIVYDDQVKGFVVSKNLGFHFFNHTHIEILETTLSLLGMKIMQLKSFKEMIENEERLNAILNASPDLLFILSEKGIYLEIYTKNEALLSSTKAKLIGANLDQFLKGEELTRIQYMLNEVISKGKSTPIEYHRTTIKGSKKWFSTNASKMLYKGKQAILLVSRDITEKVRFRQKLIESQQMITSIHKNIADGIYRSYPEGRLGYVNPAFAKLFGYSENEILKINAADLYADAQERKKIIHLLKNNKEIINEEIKFKRKDGSIFWGEMSSNLTKDQNGNLLFDGAVRDITKKLLYQRKVKESQVMLNSINKNISEGIYRSYAAGGLIYVNDAFATMFGYKTPEDVLKTPSTSLYAKPNQRTGVTPAIEKKGHLSNVETLFKKADGSTFWGTMSYILTKDNEGNEVFDGAVRDISIEKEAAERLKGLNKELLKRNKSLASKEQELAATNEELRSNSDSLIETLEKLSERNFELDQLVYRTSHDLRAPLRSVLGLTNLMKMDNSMLTQEFVDKIEERILKMDDFIKIMLEYSKISRLGVKSEHVNINEIIKDCLSDIEYLEGFNTMQLDVNFVNGLSVIQSDALRCRIIFGNIISNAFKYRNVNSKKSYLKIEISKDDFHYILKFEDNGIGIKEAFQSKIYDMFYRATENSDGSGLGMYIVKQSIDKLNGHIDLKSTFGKGTTITITLPSHFNN